MEVVQELATEVASFIKQLDPKTWQIAAVAVVGALSTRVVYALFFSRLSRFPGPFLAKFTNTLRAFRTWQGRIDLVHYDWHKKYGSAVRIGPNHLMLNDPEMIKVVFTTRGIWQKSEMYKPNEALFNGKRVINMFNTPDEEYHTKYAKPVKPLYSLTRVQEVEPLLDESIAHLFSRLDEKYVKTGAACDWADWAVWFGWDAMFNITFGERLGFMDAEGDIANFITAATEGQYYYSAISQIPWADYLLDKNPIIRIGPQPVTVGVATTYMKLAAYQQSLAEKKAQNVDDSTRVRNYADKFLALKETHADVDDNQVFQYTLFNMLAGGDSTASMLRAAVYHLCKNPDVRAKLQAELDEHRAKPEAAAKAAAAGEHWIAAYRDVAGLPYLTAVINELIRVTPGVSQTLERIVPKEGFVLPDGRFVAGGVRIGMDPAVIVKDESVFGPEDTMLFRPGRWLPREGEDEEAYEARRRKMATTLDFVFSAGKRMCTGKHLAVMEVYKFVATLYSSYDIELKDPAHEWKYRAAWFIFQTDIPVIIKRHQQQLD